MSDEEYSVIQGDTEPALIVTLYERDDAGVLQLKDLTGATIRVHGVDPAGKPWTFAGQIFGGDPLLGMAGRTWSLTPTSDTAGLLTGRHKGWVEVTKGSSKQNFPGPRQIQNPDGSITVVNDGFPINVVPAG